MMRAVLAVLAAGLCLAACREEAAAPKIDRGNPLEAAAEQAHLVDDPNSTSPTGLFERRHAVGTDGLCMLPVSEDADETSFRFGMVASFGATLICEGHGAAEHRGASIHFAFDQADCAFDAVYDGRSVRMPGSVPAGCAALCGERASFSGVGVSRVGWTAQDARQLIARRGAAGSSTPLCTAH